MKKHTILILTALLVLSVVGTAGAQEPIGPGRPMPINLQVFGLPSRYDLAAPWGVIDMDDVYAIALGIDKTPGVDAPRSWDLNFDGVIDVGDVGMVAGRYGCTAASPCYWR